MLWGGGGSGLEDETGKWKGIGASVGFCFTIFIFVSHFQYKYAKFKSKSERATLWLNIHVDNCFSGINYWENRPLIHAQLTYHSCITKEEHKK